MLGRLVLDPLAVKELCGMSRRWQTYAGRGLYIGLFALVLWSNTDHFSRTGDWRSSSSYAELGKVLFRSFFGLQMLLATLGAVSAASDLVTKEIRAGTLSILTCSPLSTGRIAFGKWKAAFAQGALLLLCGAPVLAFCVYLGGATAWDLSYSLALSFASAALGAATGLYFSTRFRSGVTALLVSCGVLSVYTLLPALTFGEYHNTPLADAIRLTHLVEAADATMNTRRSGSAFEWAWLSAVTVTGGIVCLLLWRTSARLARLALVSPGPGFLSRLFSTLDRFYEDISPERIRGVRLFPGRDGVWDTRAVLWKELQTRASGRLRNNVRIALVLLLLLAGSFWFTFDKMALPVSVTTLILWMLSLSNGASLFVTEKEERKWDILLATPLTSTEILGAKLLAGLVPVLPTAITILLFWTAIAFTHHLDTRDFIVACGAIFLPALLAYLLGALCSLKARSLRVAFLTAFAILAALIVVLPIFQTFRRSSPDDSAWYSPMAVLFWLFDHGLGAWYRHVPDRLYRNSVVFDVVYGIGATGLLTWLFAQFDRISGRSA